MTSQNRGGDDSSRRTQRGNNGNQEARDMGETGRFEDEGDVTGASGRGRADQVNKGPRGVGDNTDGVVGSGLDEGLGTRDNA